jgi:hypothetical protein
MSSLLFERDLLYPTDNILDPGILHVKIFHPDNSKMPVIVEPMSCHSAIDYINVVLDILQKDIFDRINIRVCDNTSIYIKPTDSDKAKYGNVKFLSVVYKSIQEFTIEPYNADI